MTGMKKYERGSLTVVWQPEKCIHSTNCWKGLPQVFNPRVKPWIDLDKADETRVIEQVKKCPSGALSILTKEA